jgi:hypothetical protein
MKKIVLFAALAASSFGAFAQVACTPNLVYVPQGAGVYPLPDTFVNALSTTSVLANGTGRGFNGTTAIVGQSFSFEFTAVVPSSVTVQGFTVGLASIKVNSVKFYNEIKNFVAPNYPVLGTEINLGLVPTGNPSTLIYPGGTLGCAKISGIIPTGTAPGIYDAIINVNIVPAAPVPAQNNQNFPAVAVDDAITKTLATGKGRYRLKVLAPNSVEAAMNASINQVAPNPFGNETTIKMSSNFDQEATFTVSNIMGQNVHTQNVRLFAGDNNQINFSAANLTDGVYFYSIQNAQGGRLAGKFNVVK